MTIPDMVFSIKMGFSFASCFSSKDSSTTKCGKEVGEVSPSESLSEIEHLDDFMVAMRHIKRFIRCVLHPPRSRPRGCAEGVTHSPQLHQGYTPEILILGNVLKYM